MKLPFISKRREKASERQDLINWVSDQLVEINVNTEEVSVISESQLLVSQNQKLLSDLVQDLNNTVQGSYRAYAGLIKATRAEVEASRKEIAELRQMLTELATERRQQNPVVSAALHFARVFDDGALAIYEAEHLNEAQVEALSGVLRAAGCHEGADFWRANYVPDSPDDERIPAAA
ncbi:MULTISPECIES: hypothetical protein [Streptomycetaceae]|uniref:Uncharacterized protein n=1 Tax=Streptantibioticus cattleyicolor (strain ATCC 35852 / DSM 46488 / JCM 4925 / NBRC 14057 / NRRL 8057) TaxID=1003195 RepID=F8JQY7_STREN|nr:MULTISPECIES: hypothetical protein [Streptomycetaceae]AEW94074.1 hypothetical protein SCATT_17030 [Streptantibioticus cattleyicolor NRRL 8057 = DSM 46488]MYS58746.1 hypothetical protein [Streptomyces sp. SID5468]CCB74425.1 protein of unknown function [Streptantibioticus cattleyicolor NRRL 8057 = DSM 46488]